MAADSSIPSVQPGTAVNDGTVTLYVAGSANNWIGAIPNAPFRSNTFHVPGGITVSDSPVLDDPLGMVLAPNGDILMANGDDGLLVETSPWGHIAATTTLDDSGPAPGGAGDAPA